MCVSLRFFEGFGLLIPLKRTSVVGGRGPHCTGGRGLWFGPLSGANSTDEREYILCTSRVVEG